MNRNPALTGNWWGGWVGESWLAYSIIIVNSISKSIIHLSFLWCSIELNHFCYKGFASWSWAWHLALSLLLLGTAQELTERLSVLTICYSINEGIDDTWCPCQHWGQHMQSWNFHLLNTKSRMEFDINSLEYSIMKVVSSALNRSCPYIIHDVTNEKREKAEEKAAK